MAVASIQSKNQILSERATAIQSTNEQAAQQIDELQKLQVDQGHEMRMAREEYLSQSMEAQQAREHEMQMGQRTATAPANTATGGTAAMITLRLLLRILAIVCLFLAATRSKRSRVGNLMAAGSHILGLWQ